MSAPSWSLRTYFLPVVALAVAAACSDPASTSPEAPGLVAAKGGGGGGDSDPVVQSVVPDSATQDTTLDITVSGKNFDDGSIVELGQGGIASLKIQTNSTTFLNPRKLKANITIAADADLGLYDVIVTTFRGRRGIGAEKFQVKVKPQQDIPLDISFRDAATDGVKSDGGVYINEVDGIDAVIVKGGELWFSARNSEARAVQVHLGPPIAGFPFDLGRMPAGDPSAGVNAWIVTQDSPGLGFHGPSHPMPLYVTWNAEGKSWSLNFGARCEAANGVHDQENDFVEVATTATGWTIESASSSENGSAWFCTLEGRGKNRGWVTIGRFDTPFLMTLGRLGG